MHSRRWTMVALTGVAAAGIAVACSKDATAPNVDPLAVAYSFAVIGCNRLATAETLGVVSTANVPELNQTFADIAAMNPKPAFLFMDGDLVFGYTNDTTALDRELRAWVTLFQASPLAASGVELVAIPGNHETQNLAKVATASAERTWLRVMAPYITRGGNGPAAGGADGYTTDQSKLSYSFDYKDAHFLTFNTDGVGKDWHAPSAWAATDLAAARARGQKHSFAIGHKPSYPYPTVATDGLAQDVAARDVFWSALVANQVEATFSAHNHVYWRSQPTGKTWMVIAGNGGTALDATLDMTIQGTGNWFGYSVVTVLNNGRVFLKSYGRNVPAGGYNLAVAGSTTLRDSTEITWK